jgi:3-methyl-2-oxobutanoate hydroxymethyltransferase
MEPRSIAPLQQVKKEGRRIVGIVAWDAPTAQIAERAGVDFISVGDSVGANLWGRGEDEPVSLDEILIVCRAVRRGAGRLLVSCDVPSDPSLASPDAAVRAAKRLAAEGGADMVKVLGTVEVVAAITRAGVPVFAEFHGDHGTPEELVRTARELESAGAAMLDFRHSGPIAGAAVTQAVSIPVLGGLGGGPWLDGRVRLAQTATGYGLKWLDAKPESTYANTARATLDAFRALADDVRSGRQIKG